MPDVPAQKILALIATLRATAYHCIEAGALPFVDCHQLADRLQKMVDDEVDALDAYYEKMAQEA